MSHSHSHGGKECHGHGGHVHSGQDSHGVSHGGVDRHGHHVQAKPQQAAAAKAQDHGHSHGPNDAHGHSHGGNDHGHSHGGHKHDHDHKDAGAYFDDAAAKWDEKPGVKDNAANSAKHVQDFVAAQGWTDEKWQHATVLDFGCGTGLLSLLLAPKAKRVVCVDPSASMIDRLKEKAKQAGLENKVEAKPLLLDDSNVAELRGHKFDLIVSSMVAHHLPHVANTVRLLASTLAPGGRICFLDLLKTDKSENFHDDHAKAHAGVHHGGGFSAEDFGKIYASAGLKLLEAKQQFSIVRADNEAYPVIAAWAEKPSA